MGSHFVQNNYFLTNTSLLLYFDGLARKNHCILIDLRSKNITGKEAEESLVKADITLNKNMVPFDSQSPFITSGIRIGTPAITTRGIKEKSISEIVECIDTVLSNHNNDKIIKNVKEKVNKMMNKYPIFDY